MPIAIEATIKDILTNHVPTKKELMDILGYREPAKLEAWVRDVTGNLEFFYDWSSS